jgi:glycosyltransferase involved in cell wall biosynthesis
MSDSKAKKKIILFTIGNIDHPSSRIRGVQYIPYLEKAGFKVVWVPRIPKKAKNSLDRYFFYPLRKRIYSLQRLFHIIFSKPDYFFIQKIFLPKWQLQLLNKRNIPFVYDFDDAIYLDQNNHSAKDNTLNSIQLADKVIVSNSILSDFCKNNNVTAHIITTPIDIDRIHAKKEYKIEGKFRIGWMGSFWTTKYIEIVEPALKELSKRHNFKLILIGADKQFRIEGIDIEHKNWAFNKEEEHLHEFDIGIMPLTSDQYSEAKGGYKLLMYMAAGIPQIASPVGINADIVQVNQTGFLANNTNEWIEAIEFFIQNREKCSTFGIASRNEAELNYSREICFEKMTKIFV